MNFAGMQAVSPVGTSAGSPDRCLEDRVHLIIVKSAVSALLVATVLFCCAPISAESAVLVQIGFVDDAGLDRWHVAGVERTVIRGRPNQENISTSYVERFNLSSRMQMRRCTRLTNAFSKKFENHRAAVSLWIAFYNFCHVHETLRCTPAMALGVTDHIWTIGELVQAALESDSRHHCHAKRPI